MRQQSKLEWINNGDQCIKLFFTKMKQRKQANYIYSINDATGMRVDGFSAAAKVMIEFYHQLIGEQQTNHWWGYTTVIDVCWYWAKLCKVKEEFKWGSDVQHKWHWKGDPMGTYKVQLGYEWYLNLKSMKPLRTKIIWTRPATPRHSFIAWCLMQHKMPVNTIIARYIQGIPTGCDLYNKEEETQEHHFFQCTYTQQIWQNTSLWLKIQCTSSTL
ncbi:hypothetical protein Cgig2_005849 [Carnegiea gigantea]|uniref:Reverse transcriptase zinc-binding domain-containing protein n=1 Tax=Carnegiea gigantea TaxID=171969 RepID=A0A9Q1KMW8_9CARY|nr:hypothetical protein Cgig2_005849 [Carnegiea gigantea]